MSAISGTGGSTPVDPLAVSDPDSGDASHASSAATVDRASGGARLSVAPSTTGTGVIPQVRVAAGAVSYVEGVLSMLPPAEATAVRRRLIDASGIDGNLVLTRKEAEAVLEPALRALPDGGAEIRRALDGVDVTLAAERAREADLRDGVDVLFNSDQDGPSITQRILTELDEAVAEADGRRLDINIMIFSFTDRDIADKLIEIAKDHPNAHIHMIADWTQTTTANGYKPAALVREARRLRLDNLEVVFKKDQPYRWDSATGRAKWDHTLTRGLNHHKGFVTLIDGQPRKLVTGSFNWSPTAQDTNYENLMVIDAGAAANRLVMRHYEEEFEAFFNDGRATLTLDEAQEHKRRIFAEFERDPNVDPGRIAGLETGTNRDLRVLASEDILDLNGWTSGERIAGLFGGGAAGLDLARAMQAERLRYGRFRDLEDLIDRVPAVGRLAPDVLEGVRKEAVFGDGLISVNTASAEELMAIGASRAAADAIVAYRAEHGDFESMEAVRDLPALGAANWGRVSRFLTDEVVRVAFSARTMDESRGDTGYARVNEEKTVPVMGADGIVRLESATLGAGAVDIIRRAKPGETLDLAVYGLSAGTPEYAALVEAARRGVKLRAILDRASNESVAQTLKNLARNENLDIEVKLSGRTMHQKYLVYLEGNDAFNGSANLSGSSSSRHSEDRFVLKNNPAIAAAFKTDFDRLWERLPG